jgi:hypothetical protein|tara:strand:+ start:586 stop:852 length:267 start_codon:yes stop_codon:yes gene_type:complete
MASVKNLKKDLNNVIGEIIQNINLWELENSDKDLKKSEKLIDNCFNVFDELIKKIHQKDVKNKKDHYKKISLELTKRASILVESFNKL